MEPKTNEIFVGTDWDNMVVVRNTEGKYAPTIQRRLMGYASRFGYEALSKELTSSNWSEISPKAIKVSEIGVKESGHTRNAHPISKRGLITRAILVKQDRIYLYHWSNTGKRWFTNPKQTLFYADGNTRTATDAPRPAETEEKPVAKKPTKSDTRVCHVSHLVSADNMSLAASIIGSLVNDGHFPLIIDKDEHGNLTFETNAGRILIAA